MEDGGCLDKQQRWRYEVVSVETGETDRIVLAAIATEASTTSCMA